MLNVDDKNQKLTFSVQQPIGSRFIAKLRYWWCWFVAGALLLIVGMPSLLVLWIINRKMWLYPIGNWGAKMWLRSCGATVKVTGLENLDDTRSYVFISNHRSYLDTATLFFYAGKKMGLVAKKELLKAPVLGPGMSFVNIIAIDRSNPERARLSMEKARDVMRQGFRLVSLPKGRVRCRASCFPSKKVRFILHYRLIRRSFRLR